MRLVYAEARAEQIWQAYFGVENLVNREPAEFDGLRRFEDGKKAEKGLRTSGGRPVELWLGLCLQQTAYPRVGYVV